MDGLLEAEGFHLWSSEATDGVVAESFSRGTSPSSSFVRATSFAGFGLSATKASERCSLSLYHSSASISHTSQPPGFPLSSSLFLAIMNSTSTSPAHPYVSHGVVQHELPADAAIAATYPQLTSRGVPTDAYDEVSPTGLVDAREAEAGVHALASRRQSHSTLVGTGSHPSDMEKGGKEADVKLVTWLENDPENPYNWGNGKKWCVLFLLFPSYPQLSAANLDFVFSLRVQTILPTGLCFLSGLGSSIITGGLPEMAAHYSVSELVMCVVSSFPLFFTPLCSLLPSR
jgi:hypothetical protein